MLQLIIALIVIGALLYAISRVSFIDPDLKLVIRILLVVVAVIWLLREFWPMTGLG